VSDLLDTQWAQQEMTEHEWLEHAKLAREFREWSIKEGFYNGTSQRHDSEQVPAQRGLR
jgi:hypothetical protein